jgi:hypothetical protein
VSLPHLQAIPRLVFVVINFAHPDSPGRGAARPSPRIPLSESFAKTSGIYLPDQYLLALAFQLVILLLHLIVGTVIDALRDGGSASAEYRELLRVLYSLETGLMQVKRLEVEESQRA